MTIYADRFQGRTAVVTGGASGLGLDVARRIIAEGGQAILWDFDADALHRAQAETGALAAVHVDIASWPAVEAAAAETLAASSAIDILVNSAGITFVSRVIWSNFADADALNIPRERADAAFTSGSGCVSAFNSSSCLGNAFSTS